MSREMKDSGVEWLGYIPQDWDVDRIKRAISSIKGGIWGNEAVGDENDIDCVRIADFERKYYRVGDVDFTKRNIPITKQRDYLLEYGDLIIEKSGGGDKTPVGFVALFDKQESAVYSNFTAKLKVNQNEADSNFMRYLFAALYEQGISFRSIKQTTGIQNIDMKAYLDEKVGYPQINTQRKIGEVLDLKVISINSLIEKTKSTIEDYKLLKQSVITEAVTKGLDKNVEMKDSGIEWIGKIPKHWKVMPLGNYFSERKELVSDYDFEPLSVTKKGIVKQLESAAKSNNHDGRKRVCEGDFVINSRSDRKQSCGLSQFEGSVSVINIVLESKGLDKLYIKYLLDNYGFAEEFYRWGTGIVADLWSTRYDRMKRIMLPIAPVGEQQDIAEFIEHRADEIDKLIDKKESLLSELEAYKKSLIYEYVTGKKEVE